MGDFVPIHHPFSRMDLSEDLAQLEQGLREAGPSGRQLLYYLLRHFSELVQHLTCSLESDVQPDPHADADKPPQAATSMQPDGGLLETTSDWIGDPVEDACQREVRNQAREVFDVRSLEGEDYLALWMDAVPVWGRSLVLCMGGDRRRLSVHAGMYRGHTAARCRHTAATGGLAQARPVSGPGSFVRYTRAVLADAGTGRGSGFSLVSPAPSDGQAGAGSQLPCREAAAARTGRHHAGIPVAGS